MKKSVVSLTINGTESQMLRRARRDAARGAAREPGADRNAARLRTGRLRHLHGAGRRQADAGLPAPRRDHRRRARRDHRRADAGARAASDPAGLPRRFRHAMRLLHLRHDHGRRRADRRQSEPDARRRRARHFGQCLPLHRLRGDHRRRARCRRAHAQRQPRAKRPEGDSSMEKIDTSFFTREREAELSVVGDERAARRCARPCHRPHAVLRGCQLSPACCTSRWCARRAIMR